MKYKDWLIQRREETTETAGETRLETTPFDAQVRQAYQNGKQLATEVSVDILAENMDCFDCPAREECREGTRCRETWKRHLQKAIREAEE